MYLGVIKLWSEQVTFPPQLLILIFTRPDVPYGCHYYLFATDFLVHCGNVTNVCMPDQEEWSDEVVPCSVNWLPIHWALENTNKTIVNTWTLQRKWHNSVYIHF